MPLESTRAYNLMNLLYGIAVADAIGTPWNNVQPEDLPVSGLLKKTVQEKDLLNPPKKYRQTSLPLGTWGESTGLTLATVEGASKAVAANEPFNLSYYMSQEFLRWGNKEKYICDNRDIERSSTVLSALDAISRSVFINNHQYTSNDSSALARMLPVALFLYEKEQRGFPWVDREGEEATDYDIVYSACSLTHAHDLTVFCCYLYIQLIKKCLFYKPLDQEDKAMTFNKIIADYKALNFNTNVLSKNEEDQKKIADILSGQILKYSANDLSNNDFVLDAFICAIWHWYNYSNYRDGMLRVLCLGGNTAKNAVITCSLLSITSDVPVDYIELLKDRVKIVYIYNDWTKRFKYAV